MQEVIAPTPRPGDAIRAYLRHYRIKTHDERDCTCYGCHKVQVIRDLQATSRGDVGIFRFFLRFIMED